VHFHVTDKLMIGYFHLSDDTDKMGVQVLQVFVGFKNAYESVWNKA
jgi:hypothetical protein